MKNLFLRVSLGVFCLILFSSSLLAQTYLPDSARIAFVNSDRKMIFAKRIGANYVDTLIKSIPGVTYSNLAVLASKQDGTLLIAGTVQFLKPSSTQTLTYDILARADAPYFFSGDKGDVKYDLSTGKIIALGSFKLLQVYSVPNLGMLKFPVGTLTQDENDWYVTWTKTAVGGLPLWFYHGKFDGTDAKIDSFQMQGLTGDFRVSNLMATGDNQSLVVAVAHGKSSVNTLVHVQQWTPHPASGQPSVYTPTEFTGIIRNKVPGTQNVDSAFCVLLRSFSNDHGEISFIQKNRDITNYTFEIGKTLLDNSTRKIPATVIPTDTLRMFIGYTGSPASQDDGKEVYTPAASPGGGLANAGDIAYNAKGDSVVFITCGITPDGDFVADSVHSQIWVYRINDSKATLIHSDDHAMERQPIFMGHPRRLAPIPPYQPGKAILLSSSADFGIVKTDASKSTTIKLQDTASGKITIQSATISGSGQTAFSLTSPSVFPVTVLGRASQDFIVTFAPQTAGVFNATLTIVYRDSLNADGSHDSTLTLPLTGVGDLAGAVRPEAEKYFSMTLVPNPMKNSAVVEVTAKESGAVSIEVVNETGASLYKSASRFLASGEQTSFAFKASDLGLSEGTYYVLLHTPQGDVMRKAVVIK